jgi:hypothetical protein
LKVGAALPREQEAADGEVAEAVAGVEGEEAASAVVTTIQGGIGRRDLMGMAPPLGRSLTVTGSGM